jgi:hypothetical protein
MRIDLGPANQHARMCLHKIRFLPIEVREVLRKEGLMPDLIQELYAAAWKAWKEGMDEGETYRYAARRIYAFLKSYGFRLYRRWYIRPEKSFTTAFKYDINDRGIAPRDGPPMLFIHRDSDHLKEQMLAYLEKHPEGLTRAQVAAAFTISVQEVDLQLAPLIRKGLIVEIKQQNIRGRPPAPLLVATGTSQPLPEPKMVATERDERIRHAYFVEGKSIKQIAREFHHDRGVIRKAISVKVPEAHKS